MTTATKPLPDHGTLSRSKYHRCKCDACQGASAAYQRTRHRKLGYGTWQPLVDAEPLRQHLVLLRTHGISYIRAAELAGLHAPTVGRLIYTVSGRPPVKRVRQETADALLAVQPGDIDPITTDATGTIRRIQALAAIGWPLRALGTHLGLNPCTPGRLLAQRSLYTTTADMVRDAYEQLKHARPEDHGVCPGSAVKARNFAAAHDWRDPDYWEDMGRIDDPTFDPDKKLNRDELAALRRDEILHLARFGIEPEQIHERLDGEVSLSHIKNIVGEYRNGKKRDRKQAAA